MKKFISLFFAVFLFTQISFADSLPHFLRSCAWGTVVGAGAGVVSLAFSDKPSESWNNVARGASLGLYGGIAFGLYQMKTEPKSATQAPDFSIFPSFEKGKIDGLQVSGMVWSF